MGYGIQDTGFGIQDTGFGRRWMMLHGPSSIVYCLPSTVHRIPYPVPINLTLFSINGMLTVMSRLTLQSIFLPILSAVAFAILTWPVWRWLWGEWMGNDYYSHGVLVPFVSLFLAVQRLRFDKTLHYSPGQRPTTDGRYGLLILVAGLAAFLYFLTGKAYYLAAFAMLCLLFGLIWTVSSSLIAQKLIFPIAYLAIMIPLPFVERASLPLAMFTGICAGGMVRLLGFDITIVGNAVTLPNANLVIGAQCSGINSLIALSALTLLTAYVFKGSLWARLVLALAALPLAILGNILRVASLLFVATGFGTEVAFIFYHDYSGIIFFLIAMFLLFLLTRLLPLPGLRLDVF